MVDVLQPAFQHLARLKGWYDPDSTGDEYEPGFKARLGLKDLRLATALAGGEGRLPMLDAVRGRMGETVDTGLADQDWSAMAGYTIRQGRRGA